MSRWLSFLTLALFMGARASLADIVYTQVDFLLGDDLGDGISLPPQEYFNLDVDNNGDYDFILTAVLHGFSGIHAESANRYLIHPDPPPNIGGGVAALDEGYLISGNIGDSAEEVWWQSSNYSTLIDVRYGDTGEFLWHRDYVGLEFNSTNGVHYAWLDIEGTRDGGSTIRIHGWAYETEPNKGIIAGTIPEPSSLALFTLGGYAIWRARKRKNY